MKITEIWAWIATEPDGCEGIIGMTAENGQWMPFVAANMERVRTLRPYAEQIKEATNYPIRLVRFHQMEEVEQL